MGFFAFAAIINCEIHCKKWLCVVCSPVVTKPESSAYFCRCDVAPSHLKLNIYLCLLYFVPTGDITQKGYEKKQAKLLAPFVPQAQSKTHHTDFLFANFLPLLFFFCMPYNTIITLVEPMNYNVEVWHLWHCINYVELFWPSSIKYVSEICFNLFCIVCKCVAPCCILMVICRTSPAEGINLFIKRLHFKNKMNSWNRIVVKAAIDKPSSYLEALSNLNIFRSCHHTSQGLSGPLMSTYTHTYRLPVSGRHERGTETGKFWQFSDLTFDVLVLKLHKSLHSRLQGQVVYTI